MKIIFSRKGYDLASGGVPSPIFADGTMCSLPIPSADRGARLKDMRFHDRSLDSIVEQLAGPALAESLAHLDPDLDRAARSRLPGWQPCFGQVGPAQAHLANQHVGVGDLFLFFGWFRKVVAASDGLRYCSDAPDLHCLFGWLEVGAIYHPGTGADPPDWTADHPHVLDAAHYRSEGSNNTLYAAADRLHLLGLRQPVAGGGVFGRYDPCLQLTAPGEQRSVWRLPASFRPKPAVPTLSYHSDMRRWSSDSGGVLLRTVGRGQEFVLDCDCYGEVHDWLADIAAAAVASSSKRNTEP